MNFLRKWYGIVVVITVLGTGATSCGEQLVEPERLDSIESPGNNDDEDPKPPCSGC